MTTNRFILLVQGEADEPWRPQVLDENGLSRFFENRYYNDNPYEYKILWADRLGVAWNVGIVWSTTPFDETDYAETTGVLRLMPGLVVGHVRFRLDGRA